MKRTNPMSAHLGGFIQEPAWAARFPATGTTKHLQTREPAYTLFYISNRVECGSAADEDRRQQLPRSWGA